MLASDYYAKWMKSAYIIGVRYIQEYRTVVSSFVVTLTATGEYKIDYSDIDYDAKNNSNVKLLGLSLYGKLQFDSEGRWLGAGSIAESASATYDLEFVDLTYYPEVTYADI